MSGTGAPPPLPFSDPEPPEPAQPGHPGHPGGADETGDTDGTLDHEVGDEHLSAVCPSCGAQTAYAPGTTSLRCGSCGAQQEIAPSEATITEHSFDEWVARHGGLSVASLAAVELECGNCGARSESTDLASTCQFCSGALVAVTKQEGLVEPEAVLPFHVDRNGARENFRTWVGSRRFAPTALKRVGSTEGLRGTYLPHWTFDAHTDTDYRGQRGDHYYVTRTRRVSDGKGGSRTETYRERRTRWRGAAGSVDRSFDDVVVVASHHLDREQLEKMGPWTLSEARPFQPEYLTGYSAVRYDVDPQAGSEEARGAMREVIRQDVERDIGGDEQRISEMDVTYSRAMFKLVLMPLWIATYLYGGKTYQVLVNANTGKVIGDRPYSALKIAAAVVAALVVIAAVVAIVMATRQ
ncbi:hypothetical protein [Nocardioides dongxiaopingii]|uniref:hypothetical protein n=1 Tax=Nocardioides dongxiaopingii TaxID=2576036 RepID=UPI001BAE8FFE|nr:hypothetical protein [Nocardioides dongxiaopingii]